MKQISSHVAIVLAVLFVPGALPIAFGIWLYRWQARSGTDGGSLGHGLRRLGLKRASPIIST